MSEVTEPTGDGAAEGDTGGRASGRDMTGASRQEVADLVDDLEDEALADAGDPQGTIADEAASGTDRAAEDAEPPV